jgi:hypothetical protein
MKPKLVFCGPTLPPQDRPVEAGIIFLPPAVQGSFITAVGRYDPAAILLIDGGFQSDPAVRHKEILWAIDRGIAVLGAASMGALRAAELYSHMQGFGLIYRWYRRFALTPDDAVAVLHGPAEVNFAAVTETLVDLTMSFRAASRRGLITTATRNALDAAARRLNFRDRTLARVVAEAIPEAARVSTLEAITGAWCHQKRKDALAALAALRSGQFSPPPPLPGLPMTRVFAAELDEAGR